MRNFIFRIPEGGENLARMFTKSRRRPDDEGFAGQPNRRSDSEKITEQWMVLLNDHSPGLEMRIPDNFFEPQGRTHRDIPLTGESDPLQL